jgi:hypothetical protein
MSLPVTMPDISKYYREERDIIQEQEAKQKQAYRIQLEKQMVENTSKREREEELRKKYEIQMLKNYPPFGRRTDFAVNYETISNVGSLRDFEKTSTNSQLQKVPQRYSSFDKEVSHNIARDNSNESRLSRDNGSGDKTVFGTTRGMEPYYPYGKPGNGAPMIDKSGNKQTRIAGNLWYHINGQTTDDRKGRLDDYQSRNPIKNLAKLEPNTTSTHLNDEKWILERKRAFLDQLDDINTEKYKMPKLQPSDYDNERGNANWFNETFGRPGNGAPTFDAKRHNIDEVLESPRDFIPQRNNVPAYNPIAKKSLPIPNNIVYTKVKSHVLSSHRNSYDFVPKGKNQNSLN